MRARILAWNVSLGAGIRFGRRIAPVARRRILALAIAGPLLVGSPILQAQDPAAAPQNPSPQNPNPAPQVQKPPRISVTSSLVVVPVTVKDRSGNLVPDLKRDEFRIFEDNVEQQIFSFTAEAFPISMVVLIDNDLKQKDADEVEPSLRAIVGGMSTSDEAFVCRFDQFFHEGKGFIQDQDQLMTQLERTGKDLSSRTSAPPPGGPFNGPVINSEPPNGPPSTSDSGIRLIKGQASKALDDAVYESAQLLKDRSPERRRKVILLISDGQNGAKFNTHKYDEVKANLLRQSISVYSVAVGGAYFDRKFSRLVSYAHDTGGDIYYGTKSNTFEEFYSRLTEEARNQYTLTFAPRGERKLDYHSIEVRVRRAGLTIITRPGYYGGTFAEAR